MPRLLSVNNYHYRRGGSDAVYFNHAALMESIGWQNAFFSMTHPMNVGSSWSEYFVDEIEFGHQYSLLAKLKMSSKVMYSFEAQRKLHRLADKFRPDIAHLHCIYHHLSPAVIPALVERGIPVVMTAHDLKLACPAYKMLNDTGVCERCKGGNLLNVVWHRCIRNSLSASVVVAMESMLHHGLDTYKKNLDRVVVPSRFFMDKFVEWGWPQEKFSYIPNYVEAADFVPEYAPGSNFLYFGRLVQEKGVETLMRAAAMSGRGKLNIVGSGPLENNLQQIRQSLQADISFLGHRSGADLHALIRQARAVVLPSEWYENAPLSILESYALGKPVIGARIGGIPEMVIEGETGWTFASGDSKDLARVLDEVAAMPDAVIESMGKNARAFVEQRFNRENYTEAMLSLYAELGVTH